MENQEMNVTPETESKNTETLKIQFSRKFLVILLIGLVFVHHVEKIDLWVSKHQDGLYIPSDPHK